jgi:hypothetical protein
VALRDKIKLKLKVFTEDKDVIEKVILDLESAQTSKYENTKMDILQKCLGSLVKLKEQEFYADPALDLVTEEIEARKLDHDRKQVYQVNKKKN